MISRQIYGILEQNGQEDDWVDHIEVVIEYIEEKLDDAEDEFADFLEEFLNVIEDFHDLEEFLMYL